MEDNIGGQQPGPPQGPQGQAPRPPMPPPLRQAPMLQMPNPQLMFQHQYIKTPALFKHGNDLDLWMRRLQTYMNLIQCPDNARPQLLLSLLDDRSLAGVERALNRNEEMDYDELVRSLRRSQGYHNHFSEQHVTSLRNRRRLRSESIQDFFVDITRLSKLAYPQNEQLRESNVRECFIANLANNSVSARLREHPDMGMDEMLDLAIIIEGAQIPVRPNVQAQVNMVIDNEQELEKVEPDRIDQLLTMVESLALGQRKLEKSRYNYEGPMKPQGLRRVSFQNYQGPNNRSGPQSFNRPNFRFDRRREESPNFQYNRQRTQSPNFQYNRQRAQSPQNYRNNNWNQTSKQNFNFRSRSSSPMSANTIRTRSVSPQPSKPVEILKRQRLN